MLQIFFQKLFLKVNTNTFESNVQCRYNDNLIGEILTEDVFIEVRYLFRNSNIALDGCKTSQIPLTLWYSSYLC